jgi:5-methylcytosine-specific restriction endonuclease McrA
MTNELHELLSHTRPCVVCGTKFKPNRGAKTCSSECRKANKSAVQRVWRDANPGYAETYNREYYEANRERLKSSMREYYEATSGRRRKYRRQYYMSNRELIMAAQVKHTHQRRARLRNAPGEGVPLEDWNIILELCDFRCSYCTVELDQTTGIELDHVIPLSRGGWDDASNAVSTCRTCNASKNSKTPAEWMPDWIPPSWIIIREATK